MTFGDPCPGCNGLITGGCPMCNPKFYVIPDPFPNRTVPYDNTPALPQPYPNQDPARIPHYPHPTYPYGFPRPAEAYQPIPEPGPTQRERIFVQLLAGLIVAGMDSAVALNKAFELADLAIKKLNAGL